jgi:hypothetical protein
MTAYDVDAWAGPALAVVGASAVLVGLLLLAFALAMGRLVTDPRAQARAATTLVVLVSVLVGSLALLVPGQDDRTVGLELAVLGLVLGVAGVISASSAPGGLVEQRLVESFLLALVPAATFVVGGVSLTTGQSGGGLYWVVAGFVVGLTGAVRQAWLLLVETSG